MHTITARALHLSANPDLLPLVSAVPAPGGVVSALLLAAAALAGRGWSLHTPRSSRVAQRLAGDGREYLPGPSAEQIARHYNGK